VIYACRIRSKIHSYKWYQEIDISIKGIIPLRVPQLNGLNIRISLLVNFYYVVTQRHTHALQWGFSAMALALFTCILVFFTRLSDNE